MNNPDCNQRENSPKMDSCLGAQQLRQPLDFQKTVKIYEIYRDYTKHEDNLIHHRMTWLLTIHGFLFATYGLTLQKKLEIAEKVIGNKTFSDFLEKRAPTSSHTGDLILNFQNSIFQINVFLTVLSFVGIFISIFAFISVSAAKRAINNISDICEISFGMAPSIRHGIGVNLMEGYRLPRPVGGGGRFLDNIGFSSSITIPIILVISWIISGFFLWRYWV